MRALQVMGKVREKYYLKPLFYACQSHLFLIFIFISLFCFRLFFLNMLKRKDASLKKEKILFRDIGNAFAAAQICVMNQCHIYGI